MRLERIGEDSALIARIEAINVAAFPEIERISIKNFLKMSRKGQLEIAAIFEDFTAMGAGGVPDKHYSATSKSFEASNLTSENFKVQANARSEALNLKRDQDGGCGDAAHENFKAANSKNENFKTNDLAGKNYGTQGAVNENLCVREQNFGATDRNYGALDRNFGAVNLGASIQELETTDQKFCVAEASSQNTDQSCGARASALSNAINSIHDEAAQRDFCGKAGQGLESCAAQNLSGAAARQDSKNGATHGFSDEELVGFFVYRTEQTYKRAVSHHKQPLPRLNADKILKSKAHSGAEFTCDARSFGAESDEISRYVTSDEILDLSASDGVLGAGADQGLASDNIKLADGDLKQASAGEILCRGAAIDKISNVSVHGEIPPSATESEISSDAAKEKILRYDESGISRRDESKISRCEKSESSSGKQGEFFYVAYLAIDAKFRGLGLGSKLLALITEQNPRAQIVLDVEPPHEDASNLAQRLRRIEFYGRHGFRRCGKFFNYAGLSFEILAKPPLSAPRQGFDVASFVRFIGAGNKFRFKITDAPLYKN
ncbi:N-acetyltransferase [uncultured Campylobacter sp.]|uniref:GNAT family N-acetyltransferase n=1 Tax=uncultured Campylobacter sp. TaxID=218934 RepID=UPI0026267EE3|nr:GNAT family N-acetyltransferase [uncultured Campylobacter sp.]